MERNLTCDTKPLLSQDHVNNTIHKYLSLILVVWSKFFMHFRIESSDSDILSIYSHQITLFHYGLPSLVVLNLFCFQHRGIWVICSGITMISLWKDWPVSLVKDCQLGKAGWKKVKANSTAKKYLFFMWMLGSFVPLNQPFSPRVPQNPGLSPAVSRGSLSCD